ncbi:MAG: adenylate/guanylate cyclase domain-containing protein, partial [Planctomycetes bacterium]|nr:adenylate/guanylate cyclase domain-containing protein [Planctomycetota bacterium]
MPDPLRAPAAVPIPPRYLLERHVGPALAAKALAGGAGLSPAEMVRALGPVLDLYRAIARYCPLPVLAEAAAPSPPLAAAGEGRGGGMSALPSASASPTASPSPAAAGEGRGEGMSARPRVSASPGPRGAFVDGTTLFADLAGFCALTSRLCRHGRAGAEELTGILNRVFTGLDAAVSRHGGYVAKFGGDSVLAFFEAAPGEPGWDAVRAAAAAFEMLRALDALSTLETSAGPVALEMSVGLASGPVFTVCVGLAGERRDFLLTGETAVAAPRAEAAAPARAVCVTAETRARAGNALACTPHDEGLFLATHLTVDLPGAEPASPLAPLLELPDPLSRLFWLIHRVEALHSFLPHPLYEKVRAAPGRLSLEGEHRGVTCVFAACPGLSPQISRLGPERADLAAALAHDYFLLLHRTVIGYEGLVARLDLWTGGDKALILFGAPLAPETDEERALLC